MACHEIAALRLGLMNVLGQNDLADRAHELLELGTAATEPGPLASLAAAHDLAAITSLYTTALGALHQRVARASSTDAKLPYLRSLVVLTKKVELELRAHVDGLARLGRELDEMHELVHELFPAD
ncbi:MAG: DUF3209 family protein [Polyangiaceae bacterium]|jgi:hypothetical protein